MYSNKGRMYYSNFVTQKDNGKVYSYCQDTQTRLAEDLDHAIEFTTWQHPASVILKATEQTTGQFMLVNWPFTCKGKGNRVNVLDC